MSNKIFSGWQNASIGNGVCAGRMLGYGFIATEAGFFSHMIGPDSAMDFKFRANYF
jgi:hypothetical protein